MEFPIEAVYKGEQEILSEYTIDVLVVGGGYAGINAAYMAKKPGQRLSSELIILKRMKTILDIYY